MAFRIQIRRDSSLKWSTNNPVLLQGEFGYETDTACIKIGDGINPWNDLEYLICETGIINIFSNGNLVVGATGLNFTGSDVTVTNFEGLATVNITGATGGGGGIIYAFKADMGRLSENGTGNQTDISRVVQHTTSPYSSNSVTVGAIPSASDDNKITFTFGSESIPPSAIHVYAYDANLNHYVWTQIDSSAANLNTINQVTGTTQSTSEASGGNFYSSTNLVTSFNGLSYSIELDSSRLGAANKSGFGPLIYGHYFIFFTFPS